jgi:branched-chain amino acid transport system ATP-binding protein
MALLELRDVSKHFGGLAAVSHLDITAKDGEIVGLIGPNGAGKTTVFNVMTGIYRPDGGKVVFDGEDISGLEPHFVAKKGMVRTFQLTTLFSGLTVLENVLVGLHLVSRLRFRAAVFNSKSYRDKEKELRQSATEILTFMGLGGLENELARNLPYGHQRLLSISIALAAGPKLLLLDEPLAGMNPREVITTMGLIRSIRDRQGIGIILVEHNMRAVTSLCERIVVLNFGQKIAEGSAEQIRENQDVIDAYLGKG